MSPAADFLKKLRTEASPEAWAIALDLLLGAHEGFAEAVRVAADALMNAGASEAATSALIDAAVEFGQHTACLRLTAEAAGVSLTVN